jgi:hypothetical protein
MTYGNKTASCSYVKILRLVALCFGVIVIEGKYRIETDREGACALTSKYCLFVKGYAYGNDKCKTLCYVRQI